MVCAIFFGVLQGVVFAETVAPNIVAHYTFDEGTDGWWLYGNGSARLGRERVTPDSSDYCLVAYDRPDTWTSPAINIYQLIRAYGPGTYTVHATVKVDSASGHKTRILMRSNKENSFIKKQYDNYPDDYPPSVRWNFNYCVDKKMMYMTGPILNYTEGEERIRQNGGGIRTLLFV